MAAKGRSFTSLQVPWRLLGAGLVLIAVAAAGALGYHRSPARRAMALYEAGFKLSCCGEPDPVAMRDFKEALRLNPRLFEARVGLAAIYDTLGGKREAEQLYEEGARVNPSDPRPHFELAELAQPDHPAEAIRHLKAYLALYDRDQHAWYELARCYEKRGQYQESLQVWESIARRYPGDMPTQRSLTRLHKKLKLAEAHR
jgi:tetratricopeptide (TPR) repeat protein